eukprot:g15856.t1
MSGLQRQWQQSQRQIAPQPSCPRGTLDPVQVHQQCGVCEQLPGSVEDIEMVARSCSCQVDQRPKSCPGAPERAR